MKSDGITQLVVLPLYPQFSVSTSGSSLRLLEKLLKEDPVLARVRAERASTAVAGMEGAGSRHGKALGTLPALSCAVRCLTCRLCVPPRSQQCG